VENAKVKGKRILLRCDLNVPFENGEISDTRRIDESIKTVNYLSENGAKVIICSHLGRPHGEVVSNLSLLSVSRCFSKKIGREIKFTHGVACDSSREVISSLEDGEICMLENLRYEIGEEQNSNEFAKKLAALADIYVNDAFGTCHREHSSLVGVPKFLPHFYGFLLEKEIKIMNEIIGNPKRPFISILGGVKVSDKISVIESLLEKVDVLIVCGAMAYTFLNAMGYSVGNSPCEYEKIELARSIMTQANKKGIKLMLPEDNRIADKYAVDANFFDVDSDKIPDGWEGLDIGPKTLVKFSEEIKKAGTVVWNGPAGVSEWENFSSGTFGLARALAKSGAVSIVGGGDSASAINKLGLSKKMTHISTGGGASLMFLEGKVLPGVAAIANAER
jgi:phosphoglycerate kinase